MNARMETVKDYQERMNKVLRYIQEHLDDALTLPELAGVACFSPWHFHRLFQAIVGEPVGQYVRRLRLERAAQQLSFTTEPVTGIALAAGYETPSAFNKAFLQLFRQSPTRFRKARQAVFLTNPVRVRINPNQEEAMQPRIVDRKPTQVIYVRRTGPYAQAAGAAWQEVCQFAFPRQLVQQDAEMIGISYDDPEVTAADKLRYEACISVAQAVKPEGAVGVQTIAGGKYAVFLHQGPYDQLSETYRGIFGQWLPASGTALRDSPCLEIYLNDPQRTKPENLKTDICIPIQ